MARLLDAPMRFGLVRWIGVRPGRREPMHVLATAEADPELGLEGDRYRSRTNRARQVTLIAAEQIDAVMSHLGRSELDPQQLRRNVVVAGINLHALRGRRLRVGGAMLEVTGECHPCSRMEDTLGPGGYNAVRGCGGLTARVIGAGTIRLGDPVVPQPTLPMLCSPVAPGHSVVSRGD